MRARLILGPLILAFIFGLLWADDALWPQWRPCASALIALLGVAGWLEWAAIIGLRRGPRRHLGLWLGGLAAVAAFHFLAWRAGAEPQSAARWQAWEGPAIALTVFGAFALVVLRRDSLVHTRSVFESVLGVLFCGWLFSSLERIYLEGGLAGGAVFLLGIKGTDISAYLVGRAIGRHRFLAVSPKKTLEGCAAALGWGGLWFALAPQRLAGAGFPWWQGALAGIILSVAAQIGDYSESLLKREYQVKDSSRLLPEFGGALDLIDSLIFPGYLYWWVLQA